MDAYDVLVDIARKKRTRDGGGGYEVTEAAVPELQALPARMHFYSQASQFRQELAAARAPIAPQGPGTITRERRFLYFEDAPPAPIRVNDVATVRDPATGDVVVVVNVLFVRAYEYSYQVDIEQVK